MVHFHTFVDLYYLTQQFCMQQFPSSIFHAVCLFLLTPCACMQWYVLYYKNYIVVYITILYTQVSDSIAYYSFHVYTPFIPWVC